MANQLKMAVINAILTLRQRGWSQQRIARELGIDRETVAMYVNLWEAGPKSATNAPTGSEGSRPDNASIESVGQSGQKAGPKSQCEPFRKVVEEKLKVGLSSQRIYQDLRDEYGFDGSYYSVRRFVKHLRDDKPIPFRRMECMPGDEAQVDFAQAMLKARGIPGIRVLVGLLNLVNHQDYKAIDRACEIALTHDAFRLKTIRQLIQRGGCKQEQLEFIDEHPIIRDMSNYEEIVRASLRKLPLEN